MPRTRPQPAGRPRAVLPLPRRRILHRTRNRMCPPRTMTELRDKDQAVLHAIQEGHNDTQKITEHTTLENHHVRYSLKKLENQGLIQLEKPDGMVERKINGQKRVFQAPLKAEPTEAGLQTLKETDQEALEAYQNLTHRELVEKVYDLEEKLERLQESIQMYKKQMIQEVTK